MNHRLLEVGDCFRSPDFFRGRPALVVRLLTLEDYKHPIHNLHFDRRSNPPQWDLLDIYYLIHVYSGNSEVELEDWITHPHPTPKLVAPERFLIDLS
jgi:hypothetical protein